VINNVIGYIFIAIGIDTVSESACLHTDACLCLLSLECYLSTKE
jgi:hypothetical protein